MGFVAASRVAFPMEKKPSLFASLHERRRRETGTASLCAALLVLGMAISLFAQTVQSPPFDPPDQLRDVPLNPDIAKADLELSGQLCRITKLPDGTQQLAYIGHFQMQVGGRQLAADQAIVWLDTFPAPPGVTDDPPPATLRPRNTQVRDLVVYLEGHAEVVEPGGSLTQDNNILVSLRSIGQMTINADVTSHDPLPADSPVLKRGQELRTAWLDSVKKSTASQPAFTVAGAKGQVKPPAKPRPVIRYSALDTQNESRNGMNFITAIGQVYISEGAGNSDEFLEIRADAAVLFVKDEGFGGLGNVLGGSPPSSPEGKSGGTPSQTAESKDEKPSSPAEGGKVADTSPRGKPISPKEIAQATQPAQYVPLTGTLSDSVTAAYLEGDVIITYGNRTVHARRVFYDFASDRAVILDGVVRFFDEERGVPIIVRAKEIWQMNRREVTARSAKLTTSEFNTPMYHIGAERLYLHDTTVRDEQGNAIAMETGTYEAYDTTFNVEGVPIAYWPYTAGDLRRTDSVLKSFDFTINREFGYCLETEWYLATLLGLPEEPKVETVLKMDYFSKRGPAIGLDSNYEGQDYYGFLRTYYIQDWAKTDQLSLFYEPDVPQTERGRALIRHRQFLTDGWELTLEASYITDRNFLEEYFRDEYFYGKEQETVLYLKKQHNTWAFTLLLNYRILEWLTQTQHMPDATFRLIGESILEDTMTYFGEARVGLVQYLADQGRVFDYQRADNTANTPPVFRADTRNELNWPVDIGEIRLVPFVMGRETFWSNSPHKDGTINRYFFTAGVKAQSTYYKVFENVEDDFWDIHGLRHVVKPDAIIFIGQSNQDPMDLTPFDNGIETIAPVSGALLGLRQKWQTKRGPDGQQRVVDVFTLDLEAAIFANEKSQFDPYTDFPRTDGYFYPSRPEESIAQNYARVAFNWQLSDQTLLSGDFKMDMQEFRMATSALTLSVQRTPRLSYFFGYEGIGDIDMNLFGWGFNYKISEKYTLAWRQSYDITRQRCIENTFAVVQKWPRWYTALSVNYDGFQDDYSLNFSMWPEGAPQTTIGPRRFVPLGQSIGLSP